MVSQHHRVELSKLVYSDCTYYGYMLHMPAIFFNNY